MLIVKQRGMLYHFFYTFGMTRPGIEPWSHASFVNTLTIIPMGPVVIWYTHINFKKNYDADLLRSAS